MKIAARSRLFGSERRTEILLAIGLLEETYARELARLLGAPLVSVQRVVDALDRESVVATRLVGRLRRITLNPRFFAQRELTALILRLAKADAALVEAVESLRRSPRKRGKPL